MRMRKAAAALLMAGAVTLAVLPALAAETSSEPPVIAEASSENPAGMTAAGETSVKEHAGAGETEPVIVTDAGEEPEDGDEGTVVGSETEGQDDTARTIAVSGTGTVMETPDMAEITFSISTEGEEASDAQADNTEKVDAVMAVLKNLGVKEESIQTSAYNISPEYNYDSDPAKLVGYEVRTTLTVSDVKIADTGKILSECVSAGVNDVDSVVYTCSTYDEKYQEALKLAVKAARAKAETLAEAEGSKAGRAVSVTEGYQDMSARYQNADESMEMKSAAMSSEDMVSDSSPQLSAGNLKIEAEVSVIYEMN